MQDDPPSEPPETDRATPERQVNLQSKMRLLPAHDELRDAAERDATSTAGAIYQGFLDNLCAVNMARDFDAWADQSEYPHTVHAEAFDKVIEQAEDAKPFFEMVVAMIDELGIDDMERVSEHAEFIDPSMIMGHHMAYFRSGGKDVIKPMASRMVIRKTTGKWRMISVTNAVANTSFPYHRPEPSDGLEPELNILTRLREAAQQAETEPSADTSETPRDAVDIYRAYCEASCRTTLEGDVHGWLDLAHYPYWAHFEDASHVMETPDDEARAFAMFRRLYATHEADNIRRDVESAEFINETEIVGRHTFHMTRNGVDVINPVKSRVVLRLITGRWRKVAVTNNVDAPVWPATSFVNSTDKTGKTVLRAVAGPQVIDDAMSIYRRFLSAFTRANETGDVAEWIGSMDVPFRLDIENSEHILQTREALYQYFDMVQAMYLNLDLDRLVRTPIRAEFLGPDMIMGQHTIRFPRHGREVMDALVSEFVLRLGDDKQWRIISSKNELADAQVRLNFGAAPSPTRPQTELNAADARALALYQAEIDAISYCENNDDFDGYSAHFAMPCAYHADRLDAMINSQEQQRTFFDRTRQMVKDRKADGVVRMAVGAELIKDDILTGHHLTCLQRDGRDVFTPIAAHWVMRRYDDTWRAITIVNGLQNDTFPLSEWRPSDGVLPGLNIKKRTET